ncbi:MAG: hypothetical protein EHM70_14365 [Chloroflexota bacterium]|nr:MAG: hypothetical protein EHM70_14365 [Chloroflexota bacterium]
MAVKTIKVNRAPVMTLWAVVVAERLGFDHDEALTLGKVVTGLNAQSKGQRLGIFDPGEEKREKAREHKPDEVFWIEMLGRPVPAVNTEEGIRAVNKDKPVDPQSVERYLEKKFSDDLGDVRKAMEELARAFEPAELAKRAYPLYEKFRPEVPEGKKGWGALGDLDIEAIRSLGK